VFRSVAERREGLAVRVLKAWFLRDCTFAAGGVIFISRNTGGLSPLTPGAILCVMRRVGPDGTQSET